MSGSSMRGKGGRGGTSGNTGCRFLALLSALSALSAVSAFAQTDPRLVEVIRHAQEGQGDSARIKVQRLLATPSPGDTLYPQIVYTQAMVASDAADMRRQLQRVAVEHSSSSWADDALLRLVQLDYASGNLDGAARNLERIRLDYPDSPLLPQAAYWAARTYFDQKRPDLACRWIGEGMAGSRQNVELQNQLGYLNQRCGQYAAARPPADTQPSAPAPADAGQEVAAITPDSGVPLDPEPDTPSPPPAAQRDVPRADTATSARPPAAGTRYRVQITAVRNVATAQSIAGKLKARGFDVVIAEEGGLYKVRIGSYSSKADAVAALPDIKTKLGGSPFVVTES